ncbi:MAG: response regulator transcription factor [Flavobacteriia bacterium]|nr:response regulator transcription factor [Flavobacteriia bacterium]
MINCIAIDDEPLALEIIEVFCESTPFLKLHKTFTKTSEAAAFLTTNSIDLLFLDIQMPDMSGIDFYKQINQNTMVIFTTAYSEYAVEGFNLSAIDYLLKPFELERFKQAVEKAKSYYNFLYQNEKSTIQYLYVRSEYSLVKIPFNEILYIETLDDYIKIHQLGKKPVLTLMSMKSINEKLPDSDFIRVHRSYIVPFSRIESVRGKIISMGITEIPIGKSYEEVFFKAYVQKSF